MQRGETLDAVRRRYSIPLQALLDLNPGLGNALFLLEVGQRLVLQVRWVVLSRGEGGEGIRNRSTYVLMNWLGGRSKGVRTAARC